MAQFFDLGVEDGDDKIHVRSHLYRRDDEMIAQAKLHPHQAVA